jgi:hypothetical protein
MISGADASGSTTQRTAPCYRTRRVSSCDESNYLDIPPIWFRVSILFPIPSEELGMSLVSILINKFATFTPNETKSPAELLHAAAVISERSSRWLFKFTTTRPYSSG